MKMHTNMTKTIRYLAIIPLLLWGIMSHAQPKDFDAERMNRDINIMENILQEMFKIQPAKTDLQTTALRAISISSSNIRGTYLPGYGVIFVIPKQRYGFIVSGSEDSGHSYVFHYSSDSENDNRVNESSIIIRMKEFMQDYAPTIGQLQNDERVMLIYGTEGGGTSGRVTFSSGNFISSSSSSDNTQQRIPIISTVAEKRDLEAYKKGNVNKDAFNERISVSTVEPSKERRLDLEVMGNIFETAFERDSDKNQFHISGSVKHLKLDNFGAIYFFTVRRNTMLGYPVNITGLFSASSSDDSNQKVRLNAMSKVKKSDEEDAKEEEQKQIQEEIKAFHEFRQQIKEYLVDYGRTLKSVEPNNHILVSVTIRSRLDEIPERIDIQVQKSTLDALDRGRIDRAAAIDRITVREY